MASRRAHAVTFGFDFQVNAAIVLMIENIKEMRSLRLEGKFEDIEIRMNDGRYIALISNDSEKGWQVRCIFQG